MDNNVANKVIEHIDAICELVGGKKISTAFEEIDRNIMSRKAEIESAMGHELDESFSSSLKVTIINNVADLFSSAISDFTSKAVEQSANEEALKEAALKTKNMFIDINKQKQN